MRQIINRLFSSSAALLVILLSFMPFASASFNPNLIIDDPTFNNTATMNAAQINNFLNQFPSSCISPNNGFSSPDPTGYSPSSGFTYGANVTAGQVIYDAANAYGLNPQVLISTMQKEQSLVTGSAGCYPNTPDPSTATPMANACGSGTRNCTLACTHAGGCINIAVGYGCPNYCDAADEGFSNQLIHATWLLKFGEQRSEGNINWNVQLNNSPESGDHWDNSDDPQSCYGGPMTQGYRQVCPSGGTTYYDGTTTIDGTSVQIGSGATAAMYWYTPHFSGNQNFVSIFNNWFGSTVSDGISLGKDEGSAVALAYNSDGRLELLGIAGNDSLYGRSQSSPSSASWIPWYQIPGALRNIAAERNNNGTVQLVGVASNGNIYTTVQTAINTESWSSWTQMNGALDNAALARNFDGRLEMFGVATDGTIYYNPQSSPSSSSWVGWAQIPGGLKNIAADTNNDGRIQLVGIANNGNIYTTSQTADNTDTWSPWAQMDGALSKAAIAKNADGSLELVGLASNGSIYSRHQTSANSNTWTTWSHVTGALSNIASEVNSNGTIQLVGVAGNGNIYYASQATASTDTWLPWVQMDGGLRRSN